jgi:hypothetical protein
MGASPRKIVTPTRSGGEIRELLQIGLGQTSVTMTKSPRMRVRRIENRWNAGR